MHIAKMSIFHYTVEITVTTKLFSAKHSFAYLLLLYFSEDYFILVIECLFAFLWFIVFYLNIRLQLHNE